MRASRVGLLAATPLRLFSLAVAGQFLFGIVLALPGTLFGLPRWTSSLGFDVSRQAQLLVVFLTGRATIAFGYRAGLAVPALAALGIAVGSALVWHARARRPVLAIEGSS